MGVIGAILFLFIVYFYFEMIRLLLVFLGLLPNEQYTSDVYLADKSTIADLPPNIKSKTTTKMRWAKRTESDNSFANAVMWGDLGND